ncbi:FadR/GntR family transcriptional regulator [Kitasatospora sp. NPDC089913]|uniref:FadR/GntR family transcriptional regulator n=1 Tax=Streptomycetaceae TaxID=2062 RepID=UPI00087CF234|nr:FCD domain-containing protein [Streptomyces sp. TLI_053]SDT83225.1 transcriptional regulator, GntR family [Streptomyces sp. TLI_053]
MAETAGWEPVPRTRTYELVLARIEEQILAGKLRVGDRLPPERELVELLGVSRAAIREALRVLEAQGAVRSRVGTGPDSGTVIAAVPGEGLSQLLRLHLALANFPLADVFELRASLERSSARLAAACAGADDLARLREPLLRMDEPGVELERFNEHDTAFHVALAEAAGNRLVADLTVAVRNAVRHTILAASRRLPDWEAEAAKLRAEHHAIYEAVAAGDAERAGDLVEAHVRAFHRVIAASEPDPAG